MSFRIIRSSEFEEWYAELDIMQRRRVSSRLLLIEKEGHFGFINAFDRIIELKWPSGLRVYTTRIGNEIIIILLGGNKNGQEKDIKKARKIASRFF